MTPITVNFTLEEFCRLSKYPGNTPDFPALINITYGCALLLQPLRNYLGSPVIVTSGFRNPLVNAAVGGVTNSQHLTGCAADLRFCSHDNFIDAVTWLKRCPYTDQLLTGPDWLHVSWNPRGHPRNQCIIGYYKR